MQRMAGSKFFGGEAPGEAKYEVSHVIGKGSYGTVAWCVPRATPPSGRPLVCTAPPTRTVTEGRREDAEVTLKDIVK